MFDCPPRLTFPRLVVAVTDSVAVSTVIEPELVETLTFFPETTLTKPLVVERSRS